MNGYNLGRYWPSMGPQVTLYIPKGFLNPYPNTNSLLIFELQQAPCFTTSYTPFFRDNECYVTLTDLEFLNGTTPNS